MRPALLALLLASPSAAAGPPETDLRGESPRPKCAADHAGEYREARRLLDGGDATGALERLSGLRAACAAPAIDFYLAVAYERLARIGLAVDALEKYLVAAGACDNRAAVEEWLADLKARADAERQGVPPPSPPPRAPPGPPLPFVADEPPPVVAASPKAEAGADDRWLAFAALGLAGNGALQPGRLSSHAGTIGAFGLDYQLGVGYRIARRVPLDLEATFAGQLLPWTRADLPTARSTVFVTLMAVGLRFELTIYRGARARLALGPSLAVGLGSLSVDSDPTYQNGLALRAGLGVVVERGAIGAFLEPEWLLLLVGDLASPQWTAGVTAGARVRF